MIEFGVRYVSWKVLCSFCINVFQNSSSRALIRIAGRHGRTVPERFLLSQSHPPFRDVGMERQGQTVAPKYPGRHLVWNMQHNFSQVRHALSNTDKHSRLAVFICISWYKSVSRSGKGYWHQYRCKRAFFHIRFLITNQVTDSYIKETKKVQRE